MPVLLVAATRTVALVLVVAPIARTQRTLVVEENDVVRGAARGKDELMAAEGLEPTWLTRVRFLPLSSRSTSISLLEHETQNLT